MPELPEVETVRRGLEPAMLGARIAKVELRRADIRFPFPPSFAKRLTGQRILDLKRRAKYLLFQLDGGETLIAHLGMSGSFRLEKTAASTPGKFHHERSKDPKHDHVVLVLDNGWLVTYNDPRRFGFMDLASTETLEQHPRMRGLGAEPLAPEFDAARLAGLFAGSRAPLKSALLDQKRIAGLGNIYVCEALFRAGLKPSRPASILADARGAPTKAATARFGGHSRRARGSRRGGRLDIARSPASQWGTGLFSTRFQSLRSRRIALHAGGVSRKHRSDHPVRALDLLLFEMPALTASHAEKAAIIDKAERASYLTSNSV